MTELERKLFVQSTIDRMLHPTTGEEYVKMIRHVNEVFEPIPSHKIDFNRLQNDDMPAVENTRNLYAKLRA